MRVWVLFGLLAISAVGAVEAQSYRPSFRPAELADRPAGSPNEVLVLGTPHLSGLTGFRPDMVAPLLDRLARWRPTAIATEDMSGPRCDALRHEPVRNASSIRSYCYDTAAAGKAAELDVFAATAEAERLLTDWPATASSAQRRRLALVFLAAGEPGSAVVQWLRLPAAERRAGDGVTAELANWLDARTTRSNETYLVAAQLAARLGLERLWSVEDQPRKSGPKLDEAAYGAAVQGAWNNPVNTARAAGDTALRARIGEPDGLLDMYRAFNAPDYAARAYGSDWGAALTEPSPQGYGRRYVAYWETRNLRMVANIREVLGYAPGTRLLAIVGASHKGYYEAYLSQMRDVKLVDSEPVLR